MSDAIKLYFSNISDGIKSFFSGLSLTWNHFKDKEDHVATLQYPNEKWPIPEKNIGFDHQEYNLIRSRLHVDIDDCIGCLQCERVCPVDCIKIDTIKPPKDSEFDCGKTSFGTQKKMLVPRFTIDMSECMYCNLCEYPCPEECIYMVGGPNEKKHPIDYEFSQYKREGMIFEFADASDEDIMSIGGENYLKNRKDKELKLLEGQRLEGIKEEEIIEVVEEKEIKKAKKEEAGLSLSVFNDVEDKMSRGIAKKAFTRGKREKMDYHGIADIVYTALTEANKLVDGMEQAIENIRQYKEVDADSHKEEEKVDVSDSKDNDSTSQITSEINVKLMDFIEDKMIRGMAKKAFLSAKRQGIDNNGIINSIIINLKENSKLDENIEKQLISFKTNNDEESIAPKEMSKEEIKEIPSEESKQNILFDIKKLNDIDDKVIRGSLKKVYMAGKRNKNNSNDVIKNMIDFLDKENKLTDELKNFIENIK